MSSLLARACVLAYVALPACASSASPDAGSDASADVASDSGLGHCYEIFVGWATYDDGGVVPDSGGIPHSNPLAFEFGRIAVGAAATTSIRYYNFCADRAAAVVDTQFEPASETSSFTVTAPPVGPIGMEVIWSAAFHPATPGEHRMTVRVQTNAGVYETDLHGTGE